MATYIHAHAVYVQNNVLILIPRTHVRVRAAGRGEKRGVVQNRAWPVLRSLDDAGLQAAGFALTDNGTALTHSSTDPQHSVWARGSCLHKLHT